MELRRVNPLLGFEGTVVVLVASSGGATSPPKVSMGGMNFGLVDLEFFRANLLLLISRPPSMEPRREKEEDPPTDLFFDCDDK
jgi:hypothetical protein